MVVSSRARLGEMLVEARLLSDERLQELLVLQRRDGRRLGALLVESGIISEVQLTQLLSQQLSIPWVSLYHIDFSRKLLDLASRELAERYCIIPVFVRRVRGLGRVLYVAMDDPGDEDAKLAIAEYAGLPVRAMIAPPSDIRAAIRAYYAPETTSMAESDADAELLQAGRETVPEVLPQSAFGSMDLTTTMPSNPPPPGGETDPPEQRSAVLESSSDPLDGMADQAKRGSPMEPPTREAWGADLLAPERHETAVSPRASDLPGPRQGSPSAGVTLTLLDGTEIVLPARAAKDEDLSGAGSVPQLTARDLIHALVVSGQGGDASRVLGEDPRWEQVFAAVLSILLKKHLVADWEFVEEYRRLTQGLGRD